MRDEECVAFLQWALPRMELRWQGFRRVRRQVCRRLQRRLRDLQLTDLAAYRRYCLAQPEEWTVLEGLCRVTISRFFRDRQLFAQLGTTLLPELAHRLRTQGGSALQAWSAGCASGEEPYSLALLWTFQLASDFPGLQLQILASDIDPQLLQRAVSACYRPSSLKELPADWRRQAFVENEQGLCLKPSYRQAVRFLLHDLRSSPPAGPYQLILCRNLAFTYFSEPFQQRTLERFRQVLAPGGALVIGSHESLPAGAADFGSCQGLPGVYRRP